MATKHKQKNHRRTTKPFFAVPQEILKSSEYASLSAWETKLLLDVGGQYRGSNNGDLCAAWTIMKPRGWKSKGTLSSSIKGLLTKQFLIKTRQGGRNRPSLYALSFIPIDDCGGKLEISPSRVAWNSWRGGVRNSVCEPF